MEHWDLDAVRSKSGHGLVRGIPIYFRNKKYFQ